MTCNVAVVGASGYTGAELLRLLAQHPRAELVGAFADRRHGERLSQVLPSFAHSDMILEAADPVKIAERAEVVFAALPHGIGAPLIAELSRLGRVVIDLSADFRLTDPAAYQRWYGAPHPAPALLADAVYGLPEFWRNDILNATLIASPGCYPTATALAIAPLLMERLVEPDGIIVDAKSGVSGAGRAATAQTHFAEIGEGVRAYKVGGTHRHTPEMEQALSSASGLKVSLLFTPHLVPMSRGILACVYARPTDPEAPETTYIDALDRAYAYEPFVTVLKDSLPDTSHVRGSNRAHVTVRFDKRSKLIVAIAAIDNLVKGAAGQAVQCLNLVQGFPETEGLEAAPLFSVTDRELPRSYGPATGVFVVVASMVGVGILTTSGYTIKATESYAALLLLWGLGGLLAIAGALTLAELATAMPEVGGEYVFVRVGFGPAAAFTYGWATLVFGFAGPTALIAHAAVSYLVRPFGAPPILVPIGASVLIVAFTITHCVGQRESALVQNLSTLFKLLVLVGLVAAAFLVGTGDWSHVAGTRALGDQAAAPLALSFVYVMYSYSGWNGAVYLSGELCDAPRDLPRCLFIGTGLVIVVYALMNLTYAYALDAGDVARMEDVEPIAEIAARQLFGSAIARPLSVLIGLGVLSSVSAYILVGPRVSFAMARDGLFPRFAGRVHHRFQTPAAATITQAAVALLLLWGSELLSGGVGAFAELLNYTSIGLTALLGMTVSSIFAIRRRADHAPTFRVPGYPLPPLFFVAVTIATIAISFGEKPVASAASLLSLLAALPAYFLFCRTRAN